jgi:hypothetical protein
VMRVQQLAGWLQLVVCSLFGISCCRWRADAVDSSTARHSTAQLGEAVRVSRCVASACSGCQALSEKTTPFVNEVAAENVSLVS